MSIELWEEMEALASDSRWVAARLEGPGAEEILAAAQRLESIVSQYAPKSEEQLVEEAVIAEEAKYDDRIDNLIHARKNGDY